MTTLTYGDFTVNTTDLPTASVEALLRRGFAHFMGNEQASKVSGHFKESPEATEAEKAAYKAECQKAAIEALKSGTIGTVVRGPKGTSVEAIMREIAEKRVRDILKANKLVFPTGKNKDGTAKAIKFPNGDVLTGTDLVNRQLAKNGEAIRKEAEAEMKARERAASKAGGLEALV